jgi:hypothetical protein
MEPYFFGNEKTFSFDPKTKADNRYFINGERMPMQTTVLGALRYLLMPVKHADYRYTPEEHRRNTDMVGPASFNIGKSGQTYGAIQKISPVFLAKGAQRYVRTPFDHNPAYGDKYQPFTAYGSVDTEYGERLYIPDFDPKAGLADSYMNAESGELVEIKTIFRSEERVGQNKGKEKKAFFKRQYSMLLDGWAFAAYVTLDTALLEGNPEALNKLLAGTPVYMGQSKSTFIAQLQQEDDKMDENIKELLQPNVLYCFGDGLVDPAIYDSCSFAAVQLRDYRSYQTRFENKGETSGRLMGGITKDQMLYRLLCDGSVLISDDPATLQAQFACRDCQKIGFNVTVKK